MTVPAPHFPAGAGGLVPPRRARGFALTPLADVMFQLLLFFMLTSALAPYALLPLGQPAGAVSESRGAPAAQPDSAAALAEAQAIWHLGAGSVRSGAVRIMLDQLPAALAELQADGITDLVVFVTRSARTSDLTSLVEAVGQAGIARLQLVGG